MIHESADIPDVHRIDVCRYDAVDPVCQDMLVKCQDVVAVGVCQISGASPSLGLRQYLAGVLTHESATRDCLQGAHPEALGFGAEHGQISRDFVLNDAIRAAGAARTRGVALVDRPHRVAVRVKVH